MSAKNSTEHTVMDTVMDIQEQREETDTGNDKPSVHDQQNLNHPTGLHPAKIREPAAGTSSLGNEKQIEVGFGKTEETPPGFKRKKGTSRAVTEVAAENGLKNEDLEPPNKDIAGGVKVEAIQNRPNNAKANGSKPENSSRSTANNDLEVEIEPQKNDMMSNTQEAESLPDSNNTPSYMTEDDHQFEIIYQRPESSGIRKRRREALGVHHLPPDATATAKDNDKSLVKHAVEKVELDTIQKLLEEVVEEAQRRKRRSIQETSQQEQALETSATEDNEQITSPSTSSPDRDYSLSPEASNDANRIALNNCQTARQSCMEMDYTEEQIEQAVQVYHQQHGGSDDYSGTDLASLMEMRQDEVYNGRDEPSPPPDNHNPSSDSIEQANMAVVGGHYKAAATVTDHGPPCDDSTRHTIHIDVPLKRCNCGREHETIFNCYFL